MDNKDDDVMEEACVGNDYNLQSKSSPTSNNSISTSKIATKKTPSTATSTPKETSIEKSPEKEKKNEKDSIGNKSTTNMDITHKILGDFKLDCDVVKDLKNMKKLSRSSSCVK